MLHPLGCPNQIPHLYCHRDVYRSFTLTISTLVYRYQCSAIDPRFRVSSTQHANAGRSMQLADCGWVYSPAALYVFSDVSFNAQRSHLFTSSLPTKSVQTSSNLMASIKPLIALMRSCCVTVTPQLFCLPHGFLIALIQLHRCLTCVELALIGVDHLAQHLWLIS